MILVIVRAPRAAEDSRLLRRRVAVKRGDHRRVAVVGCRRGPGGGDGKSAPPVAGEARGKIGRAQRGPLPLARWIKEQGEGRSALARRWTQSRATLTILS